MRIVHTDTFKHAIVTRYLSPTNVQGARMMARVEHNDNLHGKVTIAYDDSIHATKNHAKVAMALAKKLGWTSDYVQGIIPDGRNVFVAIN